MKDNRALTWILLAALAIVSAGLVYVLTRGEGPPTAQTNQVAAPSQPATPPARFTRAAVTADPAGFANVRGGPSVEHPLVGRVEAGETFTTYPQSGDWWEVRTSDGTTGYMASEWIRMQGTAAAPTPPATAPAGGDGDDDKPVETTASMPASAVPPTPARRSDGMIFPDSDRRLLSMAEVAPLSLSEVRVARNEIYARRGRAFADPNLRRYFSQFDWYRPMYAEVALNRVESANVALLQRAEASK